MNDKEVKRTNDTINALDLMANSLTQYADWLRDMLDDGLDNMDLIEAIQSHFFTESSNMESTLEALLREIRGPYWYTNDPREDY